MGTWCYSLAGEHDNTLQRMLDDQRRYARLAENFSELVEFEQIVLDLNDHLNNELGDMVPTVPPRPIGRLRALNQASNRG